MKILSLILILTFNFKAIASESVGKVTLNQFEQGSLAVMQITGDAAEQMFLLMTAAEEDKDADGVTRRTGKNITCFKDSTAKAAYPFSCSIWFADKQSGSTGSL